MRCGMNSWTPSLSATPQICLIKRPRVFPRPTVLLFADSHFRSAHHVEQHAPAIFVRRRLAGVVAGEILGPEKHRIALAAEQAPARSC